jgi:hypothetical protein
MSFITIAVFVAMVIIIAFTVLIIVTVTVIVESNATGCYFRAGLWVRCEGK